MLKPSRSCMNRPIVPSRLLNEPANQKKYTSHTASPKANRTLNPATDRWLLCINRLPNEIQALTYPTSCPPVEGLDPYSRIHGRPTGGLIEQSTEALLGPSLVG